MSKRKAQAKREATCPQDAECRNTFATRAGPQFLSGPRRAPEAQRATFPKRKRLALRHPESGRVLRLIVLSERDSAASGISI